MAIGAQILSARIAHVRTMNMRFVVTTSVVLHTSND
jgi:hypothetical protein